MRTGARGIGFLLCTRTLSPALLLFPQRWIAYQLLLALAQCHGAGVCHGDIRSENVALTSWDWAFLVDFAPYKPTLLPADNPADFSFFFDTGSRRKCCIAPERFYDPGPSGPGAAQAAGTPLTPAMVGSCWGRGRLRGAPDAPGLGSQLRAVRFMFRGCPCCHAAHAGDVLCCFCKFRPDMSTLPCPPLQDVFSLGCVLAELFLDGQPLFDYSRLLAYRLGGAAGTAGPAPLAALDKVHHSVRGMIAHMLQRDPAARHSVQQYLQVGWGGTGGLAQYRGARAARVRWQMPSSRLSCSCRQTVLGRGQGGRQLAAGRTRLAAREPTAGRRGRMADSAVPAVPPLVRMPCFPDWA